jgi:hypothetical protein
MPPKSDHNVNTRGRNIEAVSGNDRHLYLNEEGKILNMEVNRRAALLVFEATRILADVYCGDAVFLGETEDGSEADVPEGLIHCAQQLYSVSRALN